MKKGTVKIIAAVLTAIMALALFAGCAKPAAEGTKNITVDVVANGETETFTYATEAETLEEAVGDLVEGEKGDYGLFITAVNGITADAANEEWWCITKNDGEAVATGISEIKIADGEKYEITLMVGYDSF